MTKRYGSRRIFSSACALLATFALAACSSTPPSHPESQSNHDLPQSSVIAVAEEAMSGMALGEVAAKILAENTQASFVADSQWNASDAQNISLSGSSATTSAPGVSVTDGKVTISQDGVYRLTGSYSGQVEVSAPKEARVVLILDGVTIDTKAGPAIYASSVDDLVIALQGENSLADASSYPDSSQANAAIYIDADLTITGSGSLTVNGRGNDAITSTDDLTVLSSTLNVTAVDDGLRGKDSLTIVGGDVTIKAQGDALKSDEDGDTGAGYISLSGGNVNLSAGDDALDAATDIVVSGGVLMAAAGSDGLHGDVIVAVDGGSVTVSQSTEGIEGAAVILNAGTVSVTSSDDGINAASDTTVASLLISGGDITIDANGDGLDANGSLTITGGTTTVWGPEDNGNGSIDADQTISMTGGTLLAVGSSGMAMTPDTNGVGWVSANASGRQGSQVVIKDSQGKELISFAGQKTFDNVLYASSDVTFGLSYEVSVDGSSTSIEAGTAVGGMGPGGQHGAPPAGGRGRGSESGRP